MTIVLGLAVSGLELWSLVDAAGVEHAFDGVGFAVLAGVEGRFAPPVSLTQDAVPYRPGSRIRRANLESSVIAFPILVEGATSLQVRDRLAQLSSWVDPARGDVRWRVTRPDGARRELVCRYRGGIERMTDPSGGVLGSEGVLEFLAPEPLWQAIEDTVITWTTPPPLGDFFPVSFPVVLSSSTVWVSEFVGNDDGYDAQDAWPIWTVTGPGVDPSLRNETTGKVLLFVRSLATGERLVIDTRPGVKATTDGLGTSVYPYVGYTYWPLVRGLNRVQADLAGGAPGVSSISLAYRRKYLGP